MWKVNEVFRKETILRHCLLVKITTMAFTILRVYNNCYGINSNGYSNNSDFFPEDYKNLTILYTTIVASFCVCGNISQIMDNKNFVLTLDYAIVYCRATAKLFIHDFIKLHTEILNE